MRVNTATMDTNMKKFEDWLLDTIKDTTKVQSILNLYHRMSNVSKNYLKTYRMLWDITSVQDYEQTLCQIADNTYIQHAFKELLYEFNLVSHYYKDYLISRNSVFETQTEKTDCKNIREESIENVNTRVYTVDFNAIGDFTYTKPIDFAYNGQTFNVSTWNKVYVSIMTMLRMKSKVLFYNLSSNEVSLIGGNNPDFCFESRKHILRKAEFIGAGTYIETNLNAQSIVSRIKTIFNLCNANLNELIIHYVRRTIDVQQDITPATENNNLENPQKHNNYPTSVSLSQANDLSIDKILEQMLLDNYDGVTKSQFQERFPDCSINKINAALSNCGAVYINNKFYHKQNIFDYELMADTLLQILSSIFLKNDGFASSLSLFKEAHIRLNDFFFNNSGCFDSEKEIFDLAKHLFSVENYQGHTFIFSQGKYIWEKEPNYSKDSTGLLLKFGRDNGGIFNKDEALEFLKSIGSDNPQVLFSHIMLYKNNGKLFLQCGPYTFILRECINFGQTQLELICANIKNLLAGQDYIATNNISDSFYEMMPQLPNGAEWSIFFIKSISEIYDIGVIVLRATCNDDMNSTPTVILRKNSELQSFADIVWTEWNNAGLPNDMTAEEFQEFLHNAGFIKETEKVNSIHKTVSKDSRFLWTEGYKKVIISK